MTMIKGGQEEATDRDMTASAPGWAFTLASDQKPAAVFPVGQTWSRVLFEYGSSDFARAHAVGKAQVGVFVYDGTPSTLEGCDMLMIDSR